MDKNQYFDLSFENIALVLYTFAKNENQRTANLKT